MSQQLYDLMELPAPDDPSSPPVINSNHCSPFQPDTGAYKGDVSATLIATVFDDNAL